MTAGPLTERTLTHGEYVTSYLETGSGPTILLIHGSGPGVSARANWAGLLDSGIADEYRLVAPDVVGFGATKVGEDVVLDHARRVQHLIDFMSALDIDRFHVIGNSMGGALALALASRLPGHVTKMILMGTVGVSFELTENLDRVWGYDPSRAAMGELLRLFAFDDSIVTDELIELRYQSSVAGDVQERYSRAFAAPRQRHVDEMALTEDELRAISTPTLLVHGRNDRIIPLEATSLQLVSLLPRADLLVLGRCGHWTQIERADAFRRTVREFFAAT